MTAPHDAHPVEQLFEHDFMSEAIKLSDGQLIEDISQLQRAAGHWPKLAKEDPRYLPQIAQGLLIAAGVEPGDALLSDEQARERLRELDDDPQLLAMSSWRAGIHIERPADASFQGPRWDGEALVITEISTLHGMQGAYYGHTYRFSFEAVSWSMEQTSLQNVQTPASGSLARVEALFGGAVQGFIRVSAMPQQRYSTAGDALYFAVSPSPAAARFVWSPERGEPQRFTQWEALRAEVRAFDEVELRGRLVNDLYVQLMNQHIKHDHYEVILDPDEYLSEYKAQGWQTFKLRYWVDQLKTTRFELVDAQEIAAPRFEGDKLIAYFKDGHRQPNRLTLALMALSWEIPPEMIPCYRVVEITDTRDGLDAKLPSRVTNSLSDVEE